MTGLSADDLIDCYRQGVFPMGEARDDPAIMIVEPRLRGVIDPAAFHVPKRLARVVRGDTYQVSIDQAFDAVVAACAGPTAGRAETWINAPIRDLYNQLHNRGQAHSVEARKDGVLVAAYTASAWAAPFSAKACSRPPPTPARWRWFT